ncbi:hypothetical protein PIB30_056239 [Stylosanthes scabra]|uniref:Uncharacterized protein n=1 Tax=Stylosanthes scabra TaxID=79078 RepID=A0ABU6UIT0_9FABA|nr:hypothetical protein [Stylosanthes scabra]
MPIYHDYHGGFKNSSISSWDQIQINLKCLLPCYQPIPSDSLDELSVLSDQKQKRLCAEIKEVCNSICATLREMIQEEEENSDPEIHFQIHPDQESEIQKLEYEIHEKATIQNAINIADPSTIQQTDPKFTTSIKPQLNSEKQNRSHFQSQEDEDEFDEKSTCNGLKDQNAAVVAQRPPPEPPDLKSLVEELFTMQMSACQSVIEVVENEYGIHSDAEYGIHSGAEDDAVAKGKVEEYADLVLASEVTRPPPKPTNPDSHTVALGEASTSTKHGERSTANNGAERGAFAKGKRMAVSMEDRATRLETMSRKTAFMSEVGDDDKAADLTGGGHADVADNGTGGSSAEVGASVREKWTLSSAAGNTTSMTVKGGVALRNGEACFYRVSPIVAKPPPLLAAVFPWYREEVPTVTEQEGMAFSGAGAAGRDDRRTPWKGGDRVSVVEVVEELSWVVMNPAYGLAQRTALLPSSFSRNENENDRELLTPMLGLGPNWMSILQAHLQIKSDQQVIQVGFLYQIKLGSVTRKQKVYWVQIKEYCIKQWDPGGGFIVWK